MVRDAEDTRANRLLEFYTARAGVFLVPDPPHPGQAWRMTVSHIEQMLGFQVGHASQHDFCALYVYLPGPTWGPTLDGFQTMSQAEPGHSLS